LFVSFEVQIHIVSYRTIVVCRLTARLYDVVNAAILFSLHTVTENRI